MICCDHAERQLAVEYRPLDTLVPYARNAGTHSDAQIAEIAGSIRQFGFTNPALIGEDGRLIAGHGRVLAARKLGMETVPTIVLSGLSETQRRALIIADNRIAINARWDEQLLAAGIVRSARSRLRSRPHRLRCRRAAQLLEDGPATGLTDEDAAPEVPETRSHGRAI